MAARTFRVDYFDDHGQRQEALATFLAGEATWSFQWPELEFEGPQLAPPTVQLEAGDEATPEDLTPPRLMSGSGSCDLDWNRCAEPWRASAIVVVAAIDVAGKAQSVEILKGPGTQCHRDLIRDLVKSKRFEPAMRDGEPVEATLHMSVLIHFK